MPAGGRTRAPARTPTPTTRADPGARAATSKATAGPDPGSPLARAGAALPPTSWVRRGVGAFRAGARVARDAPRSPLALLGVMNPPPFRFGRKLSRLPATGPWSTPGPTGG